MRTATGWSGRFVRVASAVLGLASAGAVFAQGSVVRVVETDDGWALERNGEPYVVYGAGGDYDYAKLAAVGGNSARTWSMAGGEATLDRAHEHGLTVMMGIWVPHPRHGFDWTDREARAAEIERIRRRVPQLKDHPALLAWGVGNEVELEANDRLDLVLGAIEEVAAAVKEIDPDHPTVAVVAGTGTRQRKVARLRDACPSIDIIAINSYGGARNIPRELDAQGYDGPYMVTEFGPRGHWEGPSTPWGAPIEAPSAEKARHYLESYEGGVGAELGERCLGSYAFIWGWKQETTATWFGMFLPDGRRLPTVDAMQRSWTGSWPADRAPEVRGIRGLEAGDELRPGERVRVIALARDPEGRDLDLEWRVVGETTDRRSGGDAERAPGEVDVPIEQSGLRAFVTAPQEPGHYRLFLYANDEGNGVGTANVPFAVVR